MPSRRIRRVNEQLKREISALLRREVKDRRIGFVTLTEVDTAPDLSHARVYVSVLDDDEVGDTLDGLEAAAPFIRTKLGGRLHLKHIPELRFELDETLERAMRIERLLEEALPAEEDEAGDEGPGGEEERA